LAATFSRRLSFFGAGGGEAAGAGVAIGEAAEASTCEAGSGAVLEDAPSRNATSSARSATSSARSSD